MKEKESEVQEIKDLMIEKTDKLDKMLKQVAKVLASNTNYATMISVPQYSGSKIKFIQLSRVTCYSKALRSQQVDSVSMITTCWYRKLKTEV